MEKSHNNFTLTDDKSMVDLEKVTVMLQSSYWAKNRSATTIAKSIEASICISVYDNPSNKQVGFARVVTDHATFSWIADVIVDDDYRGQGIGKAILQFIQNHPEIPESIQLLATRDAHGLYERFGFVREECMIKRVVKA